MKMKKYNTPELKVMNISLQSMIATSTTTPGLDEPVVVEIKDFEDISSDLFGGESFGGAEEW